MSSVDTVRKFLRLEPQKPLWTLHSEYFSRTNCPAGVGFFFPTPLQPMHPVSSGPWIVLGQGTGPSETCADCRKPSGFFYASGQMRKAAQPLSDPVVFVLLWGILFVVQGLSVNLRDADPREHGLPTNPGVGKPLRRPGNTQRGIGLHIHTLSTRPRRQPRSQALSSPGSAWERGATEGE